MDDVYLEPMKNSWMNQIGNETRLNSARIKSSIDLGWNGGPSAFIEWK